MKHHCPICAGPLHRTTRCPEAPRRKPVKRRPARRGFFEVFAAVIGWVFLRMVLCDDV